MGDIKKFFEALATNLHAVFSIEYYDSQCRGGFRETNITIKQAIVYSLRRIFSSSTVLFLLPWDKGTYSRVSYFPVEIKLARTFLEVGPVIEDSPPANSPTIHNILKFMSWRTSLFARSDIDAITFEEIV